MKLSGFARAVLAASFVAVPASHATADSAEKFRAQVIVGYEKFGFERNEQDFIGGAEASDWNTYDLAVSGAYDIDKKTAVAFDFDLSRFNTSGVEPGEIEDDSPKEDRTVGLSLLRKVGSDQLLSLGVSRGFIANTQREQDARKSFSAVDLAFAHQVSQWSYMVSVGQIFNGSQETQDALIRGRYYGLDADYSVNEQVTLGVSLDRFRGDEFDEGERKSSQSSQVLDLFGQYQLGDHFLRAVIRQHDNKREDVAGSNIGDIEKADGRGFYLSYAIPFGGSARKLERMILTSRPNKTEFANVGGSTMD